MAEESPVSVDVDEDTGMILVDSDGEAELTPEEARDLVSDLEDAIEEAEGDGDGDDDGGED